MSSQTSTHQPPSLNSLSQRQIITSALSCYTLCVNFWIVIWFVFLGTMGLLSPPRRICFRHCLSACLLANLRENFRTDFHEIFTEDWQSANEQTIKFWWRSGSSSGYRDCFPDLSLLGDKEKWSTDKSAAHTDSPDGSTSKGRGMQCPTASTSVWVLDILNFNFHQIKTELVKQKLEKNKRIEGLSSV